MPIKPTLETIWKRPAYLPCVHPPLTDSAIRQAEKQLHCTLPSDFLDLLRIQNGGPIRFRIPESIGDKIAGIGPSFPSITEYDLDECQDDVDFSLEGLVPFDGDGHWYRCLDFRDDENNPVVSYIDVECNDQGKIADSFSSFLKMMELDIEDEFVMTNVENLDDAQKQLEALFNAKFKPEISNVGVPYLHLSTKGKNQIVDCCSISGNKVAHGYSGDYPQDIKLQGEALLFPELPPDAVIFETRETMRSFFLEKLHGAGIELVSINEYLAR